MTSRSIAVAIASFTAIVGLALSGCSGSPTTGIPSIAVAPDKSPTTSPDAPAPHTSTTVLTSDSARALIASVDPVDADGFQTGSWTPAEPAQHMPHIVQFTTPSGNIRCTMASAPPSLLMCSIDKYDFTPPLRPAGCHLNWSTGLVNLIAAGASLGECVGGPQVTYRSRVLAYGSVIQAQGIGCYSASAALTCLDIASGHGFALSRAAFATF